MIILESVLLLALHFSKLSLKLSIAKASILVILYMINQDGLSFSNLLSHPLIVYASSLMSLLMSA